VEKIIKHRVTKKIEGGSPYDFIEIFVKWEGWSEQDNTWEPLYNIYRDIASLIRKYFHT